MRIQTFLVLLALTSTATAEQWPEFRGPGKQGHSEAENLPVTWSENENIHWKVDLPGLGWSSPAIVDGKIWLTTALDQGASLRLLCLEIETGETVKNIEVFRHDEPGRVHNKNSYASPTPLVYDGMVYVHFGALGTAAITTSGSVQWKKQLEYDHRHGPAGSPIVYEDLLIINCDGIDQQFAVALDRKTGQERWRAPREARHSYATPLVITVNGQDQLISTTADRTYAYDPLTGKPIWWFDYDGYSLVPRPVYGKGLVFICSGYNTPWVYAVDPTGAGDVTETHVKWSLKRGAPLTPSPLLVGDELYLFSDRGVASCVDAVTGESHWQQRLGGAFSASPIFADGHIYISNEKGATYVLKPGTEFTQLARNQVDGRTFASFAIYQQAMYLRSDTSLYRIQTSTP